MQTALIVIVFIVVLGYAGYSFYVENYKGRNPELDKAIAEKLLPDNMQDKVLMLFLFAEKQGWTGPEKMEWVVDQLLSQLPLAMRPVNRDPIYNVVTKMYEDFKHFAEDQVKI